MSQHSTDAQNVSIVPEADAASVVSKASAPSHYIWGDGCDGWNLVQEKQLSVKLEKMPAGSAEVLHYHQVSQQFFFVLKGTACFEIDNQLFTVNAQEGIQIRPGVKHRIVNNGNEELEFLLCSQPATNNDRINC